MENAASFSFVSWILNNLWAWLAHTSSDSNKTIIQQAFDGCFQAKREIEKKIVLL